MKQEYYYFYIEFFRICSWPLALTVQRISFHINFVDSLHVVFVSAKNILSCFLTCFIIFLYCNKLMSELDYFHNPLVSCNHRLFFCSLCSTMCRMVHVLNIIINNYYKCYIYNTEINFSVNCVMVQVKCACALALSGFEGSYILYILCPLPNEKCLGLALFVLRLRNV